MTIILGAMLSVSVAYRLRMRQVARALNARFDERLVERTRMARDLHDTLLQTLQGTKMVGRYSTGSTRRRAGVGALKQVSASIGPGKPRKDAQR